MEDINKLRQERANIHKEIERLDNWTPKKKKKKKKKKNTQEQ